MAGSKLTIVPLPGVPTSSNVRVSVPSATSGSEAPKVKSRSAPISTVRFDGGTAVGGVLPMVTATVVPEPEGAAPSPYGSVLARTVRSQTCPLRVNALPRVSPLTTVPSPRFCQVKS